MAKTILVTDDNEKNRKLLRVILSKSGYIVHEAENGQQAVIMAAEIHPDLILMDYRMPVMDGIKATKQIKTDSATSVIPIFIVTSSAMSGDRERIISSSGCDKLFTKPIAYQAILEAVKQQIGE